MGLAFATDDEVACAAQLRAVGIAPDGPKVLKRELELPEGTVLPEFGLVMLPPAATPGLSAFVCAHKTPDMIWPAGLAAPCQPRHRHRFDDRGGRRPGSERFGWPTVFWSG